MPCAVSGSGRMPTLPCGDAGATLGIAQQVVQSADLLWRRNLRRHDRGQAVGHGGLDFGRGAVVQRLDADESADAGITQFVDLALQVAPSPAA